MTGLPDDPSDRPTRMAEYGAVGLRQQVLEREPDRVIGDAVAAAPDGAPGPWYRSRVLLALWALMVALLLTLIIYGIVELSRGGGSSSGPASTTTSSTPARSSTTSPTTTPGSSPPATPEQTPQQAPPPANNSPGPAEPPHHHHHVPHIPPTITLPHTVITLPRGF